MINGTQGKITPLHKEKYLKGEVTIHFIIHDLLYM